LPETPMATTMVDGYPCDVWWDSNGETVVESYTITGMAHGTPLGPAANDERYGEAGAFLIEAGISSSYHIANFFGLTEQARRPAPAPKEADKPAVKPVAQPVAKETAKQPMPLPRAAPSRQAAPSRNLRGRAREISDVITRALTAAGLMK
ncbi:esterase, partial [Bradyrhizobium sp. Leo121]